jgi:hypothetical protein
MVTHGGKIAKFIFFKSYFKKWKRKKMTEMDLASAYTDQLTKINISGNMAQ